MCVCVCVCVCVCPQNPCVAACVLRGHRQFSRETVNGMAFWQVLLDFCMCVCVCVGGGGVVSIACVVKIARVRVLTCLCVSVCLVYLTYLIATRKYRQSRTVTLCEITVRMAHCSVIYFYWKNWHCLTCLITCHKGGISFTA